MPTADTPKTPTPSPPARRQNPFEALRAAAELRQREKALEQVKKLPKADFMMEAPVRPARVQASSKNKVDGAEVASLRELRDASQEMTEEALATTRKIEVATEKLVGNLPVENTPADPYAMLALAHKTFGQAEEKPAAPRAASSKGAFTPSRLLPGPRYTEATREAGVARAMVFATAIAGYYDMEEAELAAIKQDLKVVEIGRLGALVRSYEFAANHVALMSDDKLARRAALERTPSLKSYYDQHGILDEVPDSMNAINWTVAVSDEGNTKGRKGKR